MTSVVAVVVVVVVVLVIPVPFVHLPALLVVIVVGMVPVGTGIGWLHPDAGMPDVTAPIVAPVALGPHKTNSRHGWLNFVAKGWRSAADEDVDLCSG